MVVMLHNNSFSIFHNLPSRCSASLTFAINRVKSVNEHMRSSIHRLLYSLQKYDNPLSCQLFFYILYAYWTKLCACHGRRSLREKYSHVVSLLNTMFAGLEQFKKSPYMIFIFVNI